MIWVMLGYYYNINGGDGVSNQADIIKKGSTNVGLVNVVSNLTLELKILGLSFGSEKNPLLWNPYHLQGPQLGRVELGQISRIPSNKAQIPMVLSRPKKIIMKG